MVDMATNDVKELDIVEIKAGDVVAADLRLLDAEGLEVDEFELTGEIMPVFKLVDPEDDVIVYHGSRVLQGRGRGIVVAAGEKTEYGNIVKQSLQDEPDEAFLPCKRRHFVLPLFLLTALVVRVQQGADPIPMLLTYGGSALLVLLLQNMKWCKFVFMRRQRAKMNGKNILLRDCGALEEMRDINLICFDKTGVLTSRDIKVKRIFLGGDMEEGGTIPDEGTRHLVITGCALCNDAPTPDRTLNINPLDSALMSYAEEQGVEATDALRRHQRIYVKPFHSEERFMSCGFKRQSSGGAFYFAKGDPEVLLKMCTRYVTPRGEIKPLNFSFLAEVQYVIEKMTCDGSIVIALAYAEGSSPPSTYMFLCLIQMENPLKPQTKEILCALEEKRIRSVMLTGDRMETSLRIAENSGIKNAARLCLTGKDIAKMGLNEIMRQCAYISVFARMRPSQKGIIVNALRQRGHRVAMVGDGANDVMAIRAADIGITFFEKSSPIARRNARILISDLADILCVVETARAVKRQIKLLAVLATFMLLILLSSGHF
jgi:Ca2+-transporting ATPase